MISQNKIEWMKVMDDDMKSRYDNNNLDLIEKHVGARLVNYKWIFMVKEGIEGMMSKQFKVRLVDMRFTHKECVDFNYVFSLVVKHKSIRMLLVMVAKFDLELE